MQKVIKESGLTIKEFSELYEIPYNTVRQWANGTRQAPEWVKKLIEKIIELRSKGQEQLKIELNEKCEENEIYYAASANWTHGTEYLYLFRKQKDRDKWLEKYQKAGYECTKMSLIEVTK